MIFVKQNLCHEKCLTTKNRASPVTPCTPSWLGIYISVYNITHDTKHKCGTGSFSKGVDGNALSAHDGLKQARSLEFGRGIQRVIEALQEYYKISK